MRISGSLYYELKMLNASLATLVRTSTEVFGRPFPAIELQFLQR